MDDQIPPQARAQPHGGRPTTYRGLHDMAEWWDWSIEVEEHSIGSYRPFVRPGSLVFDIGANRGRKTYLFRRLGARVIAVEPLLAFGGEFVPEFLWKWGNDPEVVQVPKAIAVEPAVTLRINRFMPYVSSMDRRWMEESAHAAKFGQPYYQPNALIERRVQATTLDALIAVYGLPGFIKIDVEGAEDSVVGTLSRPVTGLNMEFHRDWIPEAAMAHMDGLGRYEWNYCLDNRGAFIMPEWTAAARMVEYMRKHLTEQGMGSWGDVYGRLVNHD